MANNNDEKITLMFDTNIYDKIATEPAIKETIKKLIDQERIDIITTHIQEDELAKGPIINEIDNEEVPTEGFVLGVSKLGKATLGDGTATKKVPTAGAIWGVSRWDEATWGDGSGFGLAIDDIKTEKGNHANDALIATTASHHAEYLITEDKRLLKKMKKVSRECSVLNFEEFRNLLLSL